METRRSIIISVAPVAKVSPDNRQAVLSSDALIGEISACESAGASLVHLHVKDLYGKSTTEMNLFNSVIEGVRNRTDMIVQGSTGGDGNLSAEARCVSLQNDTLEMASLNLGSTNFFDGVYVNSPDDIRYWAGEMNKRGVKPEFEIFSPDMIETASLLYREKLVQAPFDFGICLGIPWAMPACARYLFLCASLLPAGANWGLIEHARSDFSLAAVALSLGATWIRVGREDSSHGIAAGSGPAEGNASMVSEMREFIESLGFNIASPSEARRMLGIGG